MTQLAPSRVAYGQRCHIEIFRRRIGLCADIEAGDRVRAAVAIDDPDELAAGRVAQLLEVAKGRTVGGGLRVASQDSGGRRVLGQQIETRRDAAESLLQLRARLLGDDRGV